jgi:chemotaxis protein MotB
MFQELVENAPKPKSLPQPQLAKKTEETKSIVSRPVTFEPVVPESVVKKEVLPSKPVSDSVIAAEKVTEKSSDNEVEMLKCRIAELEKKAAENTEKVENAEQLMEVSRPVGLPPKLPRRVPTFNESGVTVSSDAERIRIEITDKTLFVTGTWKLNPEAENLLRKIVGEIRAEDPDASLEIEGHTDCLNSDPANSTQKHDIATIKATTVMEYFVNVLQWNSEKIRSTSFGSGKPVDNNGTPEGRIRNNRIEIVVLPPSAK